MKKTLFVLSLLLTPGLFAQGGLDPADMLKPLSDQWTSYSGDYSGKRFSSLKQVNTTTVKNLSLALAADGDYDGLRRNRHCRAGWWWFRRRRSRWRRRRSRRRRWWRRCSDYCRRFWNR